MPMDAAPVAPVNEVEEGVVKSAPEATMMFQVPEDLLSKYAAVIAGASAGSDSAGDRIPADNARTALHQVPAELLSAAASASSRDPEADHYREVYDKFVQTRIECGEDTSDLTYERFAVKLMKNQQQIVDKHKAKRVRFQVYVKDGKAALRAVPVRD